MSLATIVSRGYGSWGSVNLVVTRGYSVGVASVEITGARFFASAGFSQGAAESGSVNQGAMSCGGFEQGAMESDGFSQGAMSAHGFSQGAQSVKG